MVFDNIEHENWFEVQLQNYGTYLFTEEILVITKQERDRFENTHARTKPDRASLELKDLIKHESLNELEIEFQRAIDNIDTVPGAAITASCSILEALFRAIIEEEGLPLPSKLTIKPLWSVVRDALNLKPDDKNDQDIKIILGGMTSIVDGVGALRTHAGSAHGGGRLRYKVSSQHARLTVNAAHMLALFVIETWRERKNANYSKDTA